MSNTKIEWSEKVWNPIVGCSRVSAGCTRCYAERMANRLQAIGIKGYNYVVKNGKWTGRSASVPFFFKQWGGVNKKEAGRLLDGRKWNEYPKK